MIITMHVPRGSLDEELSAVCAAIAEDAPPVCLPKLFLKIGLETIRRIEKHHHLYLEPLIGIDLAREACVNARVESRGIANLGHIIAALPTAVVKNTSPPPDVDIADAVAMAMPNSARFLQNELPGCNFSHILQKIHAACGPVSCIGAVHVKKTLQADSNFQEVSALSRWVMENEKIHNFRIHEVIAEYLKAYQEGIASEKQALGRDFEQKPLTKPH